jgi:hypothetical protein
MNDKSRFGSYEWLSLCLSFWERRYWIQDGTLNDYVPSV